MTNLFFLNCNKYMFSTYINDKTLLITCPDKAKVELLNRTLKKHKENTNKWLNKGIKYTKQLQNKDILDITENEVVDENIQQFELTYISINDHQDINFLNHLYELSNTQLFMMYDYEYNSTIPMLSIHGIPIIKPNSEKVFETYEYLNAVMEIENENRNELNKDIEKVNHELYKITSEFDRVNDELDRVTEEIKNIVDEIIYMEDDLNEFKNKDDLKGTENGDDKRDHENN